MKRPIARVGALAATAGLLAGVMAIPFASASNHREAPMITMDPAADLTDVYAFVSPDRSDTVTLIMNQIPYQEPMGGPNFYKFDDKVRYSINISNDGGADADISYRVEFQTEVRNPNTFLYNFGPYADSSDPDLNVTQTATVTKSVRGSGDTVIGSGLPVQPTRIGPRSNPDGNVDATAHVSELPNGEGLFYAGQRGDSFFLDLAVFDLLALRPLNTAHAIPMDTQPGSNHFWGYNVHTIAFQVPTSELTSAGEPVIGVWGTTERRQMRVLSASGFGDEQTGDWIQVQRLGNPLVNEVVVPIGVKDHFNATPPSDDAQFLPAVLDPELGKLIPALYPGVTVPEEPRNDLVAIFLTGLQIPAPLAGLPVTLTNGQTVNVPEGFNFTQPADVTPSEMLRLNTAVAPTAGVGEGNRLGVLGGDVAGFPNGRRLEDDVVDIALRAVAGATPYTPEFMRSPNDALTDGVDTSAQAFNPSFPYVSAPFQGYNHTHHTP